MSWQNSDVFIQKISLCQQLDRYLLIAMCQALCQVMGAEATEKPSGRICDSVLDQPSQGGSVV